MSSFRSWLLPLGILAALSLPAADAQAGTAADRALMRLADDYFDGFYFPQNPTTATSSGIHRYDSELEDYSRAGIDRRIAALQDWERSFMAIDPKALSQPQQGDRALLLGNVRSTLLSLQRIRPWQKNPDSYSSGITFSAYTLMTRKFAPPAERLRQLIARERKMPAALAAARENLRNPPQIYTEIALEQLPGLVSFFEHDVPAAFEEVDDAALRAEFDRANGVVVQALRDYEAWMRSDLLPRSKGDYRIGADSFRRKLAYDEMVEIPLERLAEINMANMRHNQQEFARVARELDPQKSPQQVLAGLAADHPSREQLLPAFGATFDGLVGFLSERHIISLPSEIRPIIGETPPFMRAITFASMDTPGPFEKVATEAYFNVTLPDPGWDAQKTAEFMAQFSYPVINTIAVHEAYPGHYVQFMWMHQVDDRVRKILGASSNAEGWAHYCEQMMLDEGFGSSGERREALRLRLGQLQDALLRNARFMVGIGLHTGQMSFDQGVDFFVREGYQSRAVGVVETKRGTSDPTYLYYTLGKLQILKLRADVQKKQGQDFRLQRFHDDFMRQGFPPIAIVRKAMLGDDSPTL